MRIKLHGGAYNYGKQKPNEQWISAKSYTYVTVEQLPRSIYMTIVKMLHGGWADIESSGDIILTRINKANPKVAPYVIAEIASKEGVNKHYLGMHNP